MKTIKELKDKLQGFKFRSSKKAVTSTKTTTKTLATKSYSGDDDLFMFI
ncbi:hypothetical protein [Winogradskyella endarachnes]|uniref:Uncharacterized protein n=1 Tax=Winogradskyella endarachnes TaxID=2681965 RepID=A0A6L6U9X6_9FLAO|nr:hypothetical protein [Winogradskyella endarachnes]MUU78316.1 hypothetical protein [Winogradskyella endarachnes]